MIKLTGSFYESDNPDTTVVHILTSEVTVLQRVCKELRGEPFLTALSIGQNVKGLVQLVAKESFDNVLAALLKTVDFIMVATKNDPEVFVNRHHITGVMREKDETLIILRHGWLTTTLSVPEVLQLLGEKHE